MEAFTKSRKECPAYDSTGSCQQVSQRGCCQQAVLAADRCSADQDLASRGQPNPTAAVNFLNTPTVQVAGEAFASNRADGQVDLYYFL